MVFRVGKTQPLLNSTTATDTANTDGIYEDKEVGIFQKERTQIMYPMMRCCRLVSDVLDLMTIGSIGPTFI
jgi:hypothetical protein